MSVTVPEVSSLDSVLNRPRVMAAMPAAYRSNSAGYLLNLYHCSENPPPGKSIAGLAMRSRHFHHRSSYSTPPQQHPPQADASRLAHFRVCDRLRQPRVSVQIGMESLAHSVQCRPPNQPHLLGPPSVDVSDLTSCKASKWRIAPKTVLNKPPSRGCRIAELRRNIVPGGYAIAPQSLASCIRFYREGSTVP